MIAATVNWPEEVKRYERAHPRLRKVARLICALHPRNVLDLGCATAALRGLLPAGIGYYACDVTDHAAAILPPDHFLQIDFNQTTDLSSFAGRGIALIHIGGILEYLERPDALLRAARALVPAGAPLIVTIINFEAEIHRTQVTHHPGWIFKPTLMQVHQLLAATGWTVERCLPVFRGKSAGRALGAALNWWLGSDHAVVRRQAEQFILVARAS